MKLLKCRARPTTQTIDNFLWPHCSALGIDIVEAPKQATTTTSGTSDSDASGHEGVEDGATDDVPYTTKPAGGSAN